MTEKLLKEIIANQKEQEKKQKEIINYLAFQSQVQKQTLVAINGISRLIQEITNKESKNILFGGTNDSNNSKQESGNN